MILIQKQGKSFLLQDDDRFVLFIEINKGIFPNVLIGFVRHFEGISQVKREFRRKKKDFSEYSTGRLIITENGFEVVEDEN